MPKMVPPVLMERLTVDVGARTPFMIERVVAKRSLEGCTELTTASFVQTDRSEKVELIFGRD